MRDEQGITAELRKLAMAVLTADNANGPLTAFEALTETDRAFIAAANPQTILALLDDRDRLANIVRALRADLFEPQEAHERVWETVKEEARREASNRERRAEWDAETERMING